MPMDKVTHSLAWRDLHVSDKEGNILVNGSSGQIQNSKINVLIGDIDNYLLRSLSNKLMTGYIVTGEIIIDDTIINHNIDNYISFVNDLKPCCGDLTINDCFINFSNFIISDSHKEIERILNLTDLNKNSLIKDLNRSEVLKLNVGLSLLKNPTVLCISCIDEDLSFFTLLNTLKTSGIIILISVRNPGFLSSFYDGILVVAHGLDIYQGPVDEFEDFIVSCGYEIPKHLTALSYFDYMNKNNNLINNHTLNVNYLALEWSVLKPLFVQADIKLVSKDRSVINKNVMANIFKNQFKVYLKRMKLFPFIYLLGPILYSLIFLPFYKSSTKLNLNISIFIGFFISTFMNSGRITGDFKDAQFEYSQGFYTPTLFYLIKMGFEMILSFFYMSLTAIITSFIFKLGFTTFLPNFLLLGLFNTCFNIVFCSVLSSCINEKLFRLIRVMATGSFILLGGEFYTSTCLDVLRYLSPFLYLSKEDLCSNFNYLSMYFSVLAVFTSFGFLLFKRIKKY